MEIIFILLGIQTAMAAPVAGVASLRVILALGRTQIIWRWGDLGKLKKGNTYFGIVQLFFLIYCSQTFTSSTLFHFSIYYNLASSLNSTN